MPPINIHECQPFANSRERCVDISNIIRPFLRWYTYSQTQKNAAQHTCTIPCVEDCLLFEGLKLEFHRENRYFNIRFFGPMPPDASDFTGGIPALGRPTWGLVSHIVGVLLVALLSFFYFHENLSSRLQELHLVHLERDLKEIKDDIGQNDSAPLICFILF